MSFSRRISFIPAEKSGPVFPFPKDGHLRGFRFDWPPAGFGVNNFWGQLTLFNLILYF